MPTNPRATPVPPLGATAYATAFMRGFDTGTEAARSHVLAASPPDAVGPQEFCVRQPSVRMGRVAHRSGYEPYFCALRFCMSAFIDV